MTLLASFFLHSASLINMYMYLSIEVEEAVGTVDVVEGSKASDRAVNVGGVDVHASPAAQEYPVWVGTTHKHLKRKKTEKF